MWGLEGVADTMWTKNTCSTQSSHRTSEGNIQAWAGRARLSEPGLWFAEINTPFSPRLPPLSRLLYPQSCFGSHTIPYEGTEERRISSFHQPTLFLSLVSSTSYSVLVHWRSLCTVDKGLGPKNRKNWGEKASFSCHFFIVSFKPEMSRKSHKTHLFWESPNF